jgi:hypothetical protein
MQANFEVGRTYVCRSTADYRPLAFAIARRTEKFVWLKSGATAQRRKIFRSWNGAEAVSTNGQDVLIAH